MAHRAWVLPAPGSPKARTVDAAFDEVPLGQLVHLLPQQHGHPVVLEGFPSLAGRQPGFLAQPVDAPLLPVLGLLLQHLEEDGQSAAVAGGGEAGHRLRLHGGQPELTAQFPDAFLHDAGVHHRTPASSLLPVSRLS